METLQGVVNRQPGGETASAGQQMPSRFFLGLREGQVGKKGSSHFGLMA